VTGSDAGRQAALAAIAVATDRGSDAAIRDDEGSGLITLDDGIRPSLVLLHVDESSRPGIWQFDETPAGPVGSVPRWSGYLVRTESDSGASVIRLDRETLPTAWATIVDWLGEPETLAQVIARYAGRDAGLPVHHTVVPSVDAVLALVAEDERDQLDLGVVRPPTIVRGGPPGNESRLTFLTSFIEAGRSGSPTPNGLGLARWSATWAPDQRLEWSAQLLARGIPSLYTR
jgi:hypothetical protein